MDEVLICRCQEITEQEIREAIRDGATSVTGVKRRTCAGMGLCQGRTCSRLVTNLIARERGMNLADVQPATTRPPVRPVKIEWLLGLDGQNNSSGDTGADNGGQ